MPTHRSLRVWLNAFIPGHVPGYTDELTTGPHAGCTVIYGLGGSADAYLTDQRMFSSSLDAASQLHAEAAVDLMASPWRLNQKHHLDFAMPLGPDGEPMVAETRPDDSQLVITMATPRTLSTQRDLARAIGMLPHRGSASPDQVYLHFSGKVRPPAEKMAEQFGDLSYDGVAIVDVQQGTLEFQGAMHRFPAFEMYAQWDEATPVAVFRLSPPRGGDALQRSTGGPRPVRASVAL